MFEDIVIATLFRQFHRDVDDALLDRAATAAGCASGIGRMSLLSDEVMSQFTKPLNLRAETTLLDLGCGRGFLARWLRWAGLPVSFTGIDRAPEALVAADRLVPGAKFIEGDYRTHHFNEQFDVVTSIEVATSSAMDKPVLAAIRSRLHDGGRFGITAASTGGNHARRIANLRELLAQHFSNYDLRDVSEEAAAFTKRLYGALLEIDEWPPLIAPRIKAQAAEVLAAVDRGEFAYTLVWGTA